MFISEQLDEDLNDYEAGADTQDEVVHLFLVLDGVNIRNVLHSKVLGAAVLPV